MWIYKSSVGTFSIRKQSNGFWGPLIDNEALGAYNSPEGAADDVYTQHTGHDSWDLLPPVIEPTDLTEWEKRGGNP